MPLKIKKCKKNEVLEILKSEFPIDYPLTDLNLSTLSFACSLTTFDCDPSE